MKNFILSAICIVILIAAWCGFDLYSDRTLQGYMAEIETEVIASIDKGNWDKAAAAFSRTEKDWHKYKKHAAFFLDTRIMNDTDFSFARAKYYIKEKDSSNSTGELSCLREQLRTLHSNEELTLGNLL